MTAPPSLLAPGSRILVTGGSGFIGTNLVERYRQEGFAVRSLDLAEPRNGEHREVWRRADLTDRDKLIAAVREFAPTHILHFGARTDLGGSTVDDYAANVAGTRNMVAAADAVDSLERIIFASSMLVCRFGYIPAGPEDTCPSTPYGESKVLGEQIVRGVPPRAEWLIVRPTSIWGPWFGSPYRDFFAAVASGRYMHPGRRGALQTYGYVGNAVHSVDRLLASPDAVGNTYYLGDWPSLNLRDWADAIAEAAGRRRPRTAPLPLLRAAARAGDVIDRVRPGAAPLTTFRLGNMTTDNRLDLTDLRAVVGDELPWEMGEGVQETTKWAAQHPLE